MRRLLERAAESGRLGAAALIALSAAPLVARPALASTFQVNPVVLEVTPAQRSAVLSVRNVESDAVSIRVRLYRWTQRDGDDVYTETDALIASPPIFQLAGGATQLLRLGPRAQPLSGAYRIIVEEIPPSVPQDHVKIALRLNLPLYVTPDRTAKAALSWAGWRDAAGDLVLEASNRGNRYASIVEINATDATGAPVVLTSRPGAVLPGGNKRWAVGRHSEWDADATLSLTTRDSNGAISRSHVVLAQR